MNSLVPACPDTLIEARSLSIRRRQRQILSNVDLSVDRGEIVTLIGPNGAGKTTLVRALLGLAAADHGSTARQPGIRIGYVPQSLSIDRTLPLTVRRFLCLAGRRPATELAAVLGRVGGGHLIDAPFQALSGGEAKRVMLARALLNRPDLLVLDEPAANMDVGGQAAFYDLIQTIRDQNGCGILIVSHDLHLVMAATDRVVCLNGHVCCSGKPDMVSRDPEYLALFGDRVGGRLAVYPHHHDHDHDLAGSAVHAQDAAPGQGQDG